MHSRGQAIVELALVTPAMLILLLLAVDFGRLFFTFVAVNNAAHEGAFYAAEHASHSPFDQTVYFDGVAAAALREVNEQRQGGEGVMQASAPSCFTPGSGTAVGCDGASNFAGGIGNQVSVSVRQPFMFLTPMVTDIIGGPLNLDGVATAPVLSPAAVSITASSPSPTQTPSPAPTSTPTATPTATPTPTPQCPVPDFFNTHLNDPDALNT